MLGRENAFLGCAGEKSVWLSFNTIPAKIHTSHEILTYLKLLTFSVRGAFFICIFFRFLQFGFTRKGELETFDCSDPLKHQRF